MLFPYSRSELQRIFSVLLIRLGEGDDAKRLEDKLVTILSSDPICLIMKEITSANQAGIDRKVSEYHGINVETLLISPNLGVLRQEYIDHLVRGFVQALVSVLEVTEEEAWAFVAKLMALI